MFISPLPVCDKYFGAPALEFLMTLQVRESETI